MHKHIEAVSKSRLGSVATVVIPVIVAKHWWQILLHNQTTPYLRRTLASQSNGVLITVTYRLKE